MIVRLDSTQLVASAEPLAFAVRNRMAIEAYWRQAKAANPRLWNGAQFLFTDVTQAAGILSGTAHRTDYATFLFWRDHGRDRDAMHVTGTSLPVTADGLLLAARMAAHTANAGQIYFPAGSLETGDLVDGRFDITASIRREMAEEIGSQPPLGSFDDHLVAVTDNNVWFVARRCHLSLSFDDCVRHFQAHQRATGDDEIAELVAIGDVDDANRLKSYAKILARWHFGDERIKYV